MMGGFVCLFGEVLGFIFQVYDGVGVVVVVCGCGCGGFK